MSIKNWIKYYRNSLADGELIDIKTKDCEEGFFFDSFSDLNQKNLKALYNDFRKTSNSKKQEKSLDNDEEEVSPIDVFIAPLYLNGETIHNSKSQNQSKVFPFWMPASLDEKGLLNPVGDENKVPWFVRSVLEPIYSNTNYFPIISSMKEVDKVFDSHVFNFDSWLSFWKSSEAFFEKVTGSKFEDFKYENYVTNNQICIIKAKDIVAARNILLIYDDLKNTKESPPLISNLLSFQNSKRSALPDDLDLFLNQGHYGQYNNQFPLSISQRKSLLIFEKESKGNILAVNGPPGTGKTTLLQSVVANEVVKAVLSGNSPPKIVASSTNNQAITNILDSFGSTNDSLERWLPNLTSLGSYLISSDSQKQNEATKKGYQILTRSNDNLDGGYFNHLHSANIKELEKYYVSYFLKNYKADGDISVQEIAEILKSNILKTTSKIDLVLNTIDKVKKAEKEYFQLNQLPDFFNSIERLKKDLVLNKEEKEIRIKFRDNYHQFLVKNKFTLIFSFIPSINQRYINKLGLFLIDSPSQDLKGLTSNKAVESQLLLSLQKLDKQIADGSKEISEKQKTYDYLSQLKLQYEKQVNELNLLWEDYLSSKKPNEKKIIEKEFENLAYHEKANRILDISLRYNAFINAVHYWEGLWILEQQSDELKINKGLASRKNIFTRISYLTPLFISTFHSLPGFCSYYEKTSDKWEQKPIYNLFDLLIVDEAGQVSPEVGIAAFSLAKKALVVGDIYQIEPVWNIAFEKIDKGNLNEAKLLKEFDYNELKEWGVLCSSGSLMHLAQKVSTYEVNDHLGGTLLTEHRRCVDELVSFSNHFVYDDMLKPMVGSSKGNEFKNEKDEIFLPPLCYLNIRGVSDKKSGSTFNVIEAQSIAKWIHRYGKLILAYYNKGKSEDNRKSLKDCLAVVTPFSEQKNEIYRQFLEYKIDSDITVGTVHALQGAERPIVIFSPAYGVNQRGSNLFFDNGYNMLNVALTRAKHHFIVMGNMALFNPLNTQKPSGGLAKYLFADEINELSTSFLFNDIIITSENRVDSLEKHQKCLKRAFEKANKRVIIVSPFISIQAINADNLLPDIKNAISNQIEVEIYTDKFLDIQNGELKKNSKEGRSALINAGAKINILNGIHNKALVIDEEVLIEGSFNWLSAVRDKNNAYYRYEVSQIIQGKEAKIQITQLLTELSSISN